MKAMIFAAGLGTRLKPITDTLPKALVPIAGRPLIEHTCRRLISAGIGEAVVNVHHFADKLEEWIASQQLMHLDVSDERSCLLETGGAILHARKFLEGCGRFLIHNVDILSDCDIPSFASQVRPDALATLLVSPRTSTRYFLFHPRTMRLVGWKNVSTGEQVLTDPSMDAEECKAYAFSGIHILSDKVFDLMDEYVRSENLPVGDAAGTRFPIRDFYLWAASRAGIYGVPDADLRMIDVGKLDAIAPAEDFVKSMNQY